MALERILEILIQAKPADRARIESIHKHYLGPYIASMLKWLASSVEYTNFTYDLTRNNLRQMQCALSLICDTEVSEVARYFQELDQDASLQQHHQQMAATIHGLDNCLRPGRRVFWYALVRTLKPRLIVETGVDKGLGSVVLCAAIERNRADGFEGAYLGTDINPKAGGLLCGRYKNFGSIVYGDSIESLKKLDRPIDIFINDSDHSLDYESREYMTVRDKLSSNAIVLGDNSHVGDRLIDFALQTNRSFLFVSERPNDHWYPGAGVGVAFPKGRPAPFQ